jgi:hypothetical protein
VPKGRSADTDALDPEGLVVYRTLVLRRSPVQSRPPGAYRLRWSGRDYEVWQRRPGDVVSPRRLGLGGRLDPDARPECAAVRRLAADGDLLAARAAPRVRVALSDGASSLPEGWVAAGGPAAIPAEPAAMRLEFSVPRAGAYEAWLRGSVRPAAELSVDDETVGSIRHELNNLGGFASFGNVELERGRHEAELRLDAPDAHPGSGGVATAIGPLVLSAGEAADAELVRVAADDAPSLCGREWDWVERAP